MTKIATMGFDNGHPPLLGLHEFELSADGQMRHAFNGQHRATVPPEGWEGYAETYPACQPVITAARLPAAAEPTDNPQA